MSAKDAHPTGYRVHVEGRRSRPPGMPLHAKPQGRNRIGNLVHHSSIGLLLIRQGCLVTWLW